MSDYKQGHRRRARNRVENIDVEYISERDLLEIILFYALPRRDTKPPAAALLNAFGSLEAVFCADKRALMSVEGVGERTADWLRALGAAVFAYADLLPSDRPQLFTAALAKEFSREYLPVDRRALMQFNLNSCGYLLGCHEICRDRDDMLALRDAFASALAHHAHSVVLSLSDARDSFTDEDYEFIAKYARTFSVADVQLLDYVRVFPGGAISMREQGYMDNSESFVALCALNYGYLRR